MKNLCKISVVCTAEGALKKLKRAGVPVYCCKKEGARFCFGVNDKHVKKVFAIFAKPCYNIRTERKSAVKRALSLAVLRAGLIVGAILFAAVAALSQQLVLRVEVTGSGAYLKEEVLSALNEEGGGRWRLYSDLDTASASARIMALAGVTFCNISKKGSVLTVDVRTSPSAQNSLLSGDLVSDCDGSVSWVKVVCGTAAVEAGQNIKKGDPIILAEEAVGEDKRACIAVGACAVERRATFEYFAPDGGEQNLRRAYAAADIEGDKIISRTHSLRPCEGGVVIVIDTLLLHKLSINLT